MNALTKSEPAEVLLPIDPMVSMIERVAMDPNSDLTKLERMIELKERHDASSARAEFAAAFAKASASFPTIPLNGKSNNGMYATLEDITKLTRPVLSEHGLAMTFAVVVGQDVVVTAKLMHKSGHCEETSIALPRDTSGSKNAVQAVGSTQKYGQRYTAQAILGLSLGKDDEDDGASSGPITHDAPKRTTDQWTATILQELPDNATPRDKAQAVAQALCAQFRRMKGVKQIGNEWDRRAHLIEKMESAHPDLHETVCDAYANRLDDIKESKT